MAYGGFIMDAAAELGRNPVSKHQIQPEYGDEQADALCRRTLGLPSSAAASIYETAIRHRVSPEFIGSRNCVPMAFTAESPPAQGQ